MRGYRWVLGTLISVVLAGCGATAGDGEGAAQTSATLLTTDLYPTADTNIRKGKGNKNFGDDLHLEVRKPTNRLSLVAFDAAAIQTAIGDGTLLSATLTLTITGKPTSWGATGRDVGVYPIRQTWTELGATYKCAEDANPSNSKTECVDDWEPGANIPVPVDSPTDTVTVTNGMTGSISFDVSADIAAGESQWAVAEAVLAAGNIKFHARESANPPVLSLELETPCVAGASGSGVYEGDLVIDDDDTAGDLASLEGIHCVVGNLAVFQTDLTDLTALAGLSGVTGILQIQSNGSLTSLEGLENLSRVDELWVIWNNALNSLEPLSGVTSTSNVFVIENNALQNLSGLQGITTVDELNISNNGALQTMDGLDNLTSVAGDFNIDSPVLTDMTALANLESVGGQLTVSYSQDLEYLTGLDNLTSIGGSLRIGPEVGSLKSVQSLSGVVSIGADLVISDAILLENLHGLEGISTVPGGLLINSVAALLDLTGLDSVTTVGTYFRVEQNVALTSLDGLGNLTQVGSSPFPTVTIADNPSLPQCEANALANQVGASCYQCDGNESLCN